MSKAMNESDKSGSQISQSHRSKSIFYFCENAFEQLRVDAAKTQIFYFHELVHSIFRAFAPEPGLFHAAKGRNFRRYQSGIDSHDSILESFRDPPNACDIFSEEIRSQSKFRIICERDRFCFGLESKQRRHWAKG